MSHYISKLNENIERIHVRYQNRYGIAIAGDLYTRKDLDKKKTYAAVVVGAPYGGVKEQGPSVYANELAQRGFVVAGQKEIEAGPASHGAEVENFRPEVRVISEKCGAQMFNSVNLRGIHHRLLVGGGHPDVEGGNAGVAHRVLPGNVDPGLQFQMVYGETCDLLHDISFFLI